MAKYKIPMKAINSIGDAVGKPEEIILVNDLSRKGTLVGYAVDDYSIKNTMEVLVRHSLAECIGKPHYVMMDDLIYTLNPETMQAARGAGTIYAITPGPNDTPYWKAYSDPTEVPVVGFPHGPIKSVGGYAFRMPYPPWTAGLTATVGMVVYHNSEHGDTRLLYCMTAVGVLPEAHTLRRLDRYGAVATDTNGNEWVVGEDYEPFYGAFFAPSFTQDIGAATNGNGSVFGSVSQVSSERIPSLIEGQADIGAFVDTGGIADSGWYKSIAAQPADRRVAQWVIQAEEAPTETDFSIREANTIVGSVRYNWNTNELTTIGGVVAWAQHRRYPNGILHLWVAADIPGLEAHRIYVHASSAARAEACTLRAHYQGTAEADFPWPIVPDASTRPGDISTSMGKVADIWPTERLDPQGRAFLIMEDSIDATNRTSAFNRPLRIRSGHSVIGRGSGSVAARQWLTDDGVTSFAAQTYPTPETTTTAVAHWAAATKHIELVAPGKLTVGTSNAYGGSYNPTTEDVLTAQNTRIPQALRALAYWDDDQVFDTDEAFGPANYTGQPLPALTGPTIDINSLVATDGSIEADVSTDESATVTLEVKHAGTDTSPDALEHTLEVAGLLPDTLYSWVLTAQTAYGISTRWGTLRTLNPLVMTQDADYEKGVWTVTDPAVNYSNVTMSGRLMSEQIYIGEPRTVTAHFYRPVHGEGSSNINLTVSDSTTGQKKYYHALIDFNTGAASTLTPVPTRVGRVEDPTTDPVFHVTAVYFLPSVDGYYGIDLRISAPKTPHLFNLEYKIEWRDE